MEKIMIDNPSNSEIANADYPTDEEADSVPKFKIFSYPQDTTLAGYFELWKGGDLFIPEFQRDYVWDIRRASKLIESFILGVPVPNIFLYKKEDDNRYWIVDGQQRIKTILSFFNGEFVDGNLSDGEQESRRKIFRLKGLENENWNGKTFEDIDDKIKSILKKSILRSVVINQVDPKDNESIYYIFERLNTGGLLLNPMEVRMCVSDGNFASLLKKLNGHEKWRALIAKPTKDKRYRDVEWILRIFALHDEFVNYTSPMKNFLNFYMHKNSNANEEWLNGKEKLFECTIEKVISLPRNPFRISGRFNLSFFDSFLVALMHNYDSNFTPDKVMQVHEYLTKQTEYIETVTIGRGTGDINNVQERIRLALESFERN